MKSGAITLFILLFIPFIHSANGFESVPQQNKCLIQSVSVYEDTSGEKTLEEIIQFPDASFTRIPDKIVSMGTVSNPLWFRISIANPENSQLSDFVLDLGFPIIKKASLYWVDNGKSIHSIQSLRTKTLNQEDPLLRQLIFPLPVISANPILFYVKIDTPTVVFAPITVSHISTIIGNKQKRAVLHGIIIGILIIMALYNAIIAFRAIVPLNYFLYVLYALSMAVYFFSINGYPYILGVSISQHTAMCILGGSLGMGLIFAAHFSRTFLELKSTSPICNYLIWGISIISAATMVFSLVSDNYLTSNRIMTALGVILPFCVIVSSIIAIRHKVRAAWIFLSAWGILIIGSMVYALTFLRLIPFSFWTFHSVQFAASIETFLLSIALSDRIKFIIEDRERIQLLQKRYQELSITDGLTQLYNRRHFNTTIDIEIERAKNDGTQLAMALFDIDYFKVINDTHGHPYGDDVLRSMGKIILQSIRKYDTAFRYGGEEFAVLMPGTSLEEAIQAAERIRKRFCDCEYVTPLGKKSHATVSAGVAEFYPESTATELICLADKGLYAAKRAGRNRIETGSETVGVACAPVPTTTDKRRKLD